MKMRGSIPRFSNAAEAMAQGYTFPDKLKDKDATPPELREHQEWLRFENTAGQLSVPVWLDDATGFRMKIAENNSRLSILGYVVQMYPPK